MRKKKVSELRALALASPDGMSRNSFKNDKKNHSNGLLRLSEPKQRVSRRQMRLGIRWPGYPKDGVVIPIRRRVFKGKHNKRQHRGRISFVCILPTNAHLFFPKSKK